MSANRYPLEFGVRLPSLSRQIQSEETGGVADSSYTV